MTAKYDDSMIFAAIVQIIEDESKTKAQSLSDIQEVLELREGEE